MFESWCCRSMHNPSPWNRPFSQDPWYTMAPPAFSYNVPVPDRNPSWKPPVYTLFQEVRRYSKCMQFLPKQIDSINIPPIWQGFAPLAILPAVIPIAYINSVILRAESTFSVKSIILETSIVGACIVEDQSTFAFFCVLDKHTNVFSQWMYQDSMALLNIILKVTRVCRSGGIWYIHWINSYSHSFMEIS